jgi:hypothetical protein
MKKNEKIILDYYEKKKKFKSNSDLKRFFKNKVSNKKYKEIDNHLKRYKKISDKKIKEILDVNLSYYQILKKKKNEEFYKKYNIKKFEKNYFEGKFNINRNKVLVEVDSFNLKLRRARFSKKTIENMKKGKKLSKNLQRKLDKFIQNNFTMLEKSCIVELTKKKIKNKRKKITEKDYLNTLKKLEKRVNKLKKDLTADKIEKFTIYDFLY